MKEMRVVEAIERAAAIHAGQSRKGKTVPYLFHLLGVASIVAEAGGDEDQVIAALLHDAVEDGGGAPVLEEIRARWGDDVARIVDGCTDADVTPKPPWRQRKETYIARVRDEPGRVKLVSVADKLHNLRAIEADLRDVGDDVWDRFRGRRDGTLWYYEAVLDAIGRGWTHPLLDEARRTLDRVRALARGA